MSSKTTSKMVRFALSHPLPPLTAAQRAELDALAQRPDADIDLRDIPEQLDWNSAERGRFYRPVKNSTTVRIDADVLHWLKSQGKGYQTRLNAILRAAMLKDVG
jgi:uncharacterized protein (DUF4415 family)